MLLSSLMFTNSYENLKNDIIEENYNYEKKQKKISSYLFFLGAIAFLCMELVLFYYAIIIAKKSSKSTDELIINIILSIIFTTPYVFFNMLSNPVAKNLFR